MCEKSNYKVKKTNTTSYGLKSVRSLGPKIWALIRSELRAIEALKKFKDEIKKFRFDKCPFNLCKTYILGVGLID